MGRWALRCSRRTPVFHRLSPTDEEIRDLVETLSTRIVKCLKKRGSPVDEESEISEDENEAFSDVQSASVQSLIALGERLWQKVRRLGIIASSGFDDPSSNRNTFEKGEGLFCELQVVFPCYHTGAYLRETGPKCH